MSGAPAARRAALRPQYSERTMRAFEMVFSRWRARHIYTHIVSLPPRLPDRTPLILVANHPSWWDGFLLRDVQRSLRPGRPLFSVMIDQELAAHPFLRRIGGVPLEPGSTASMLALVRSLQRAAHHAPGMCVSWFPQGRITPSWQRPLDFRRGIEVIARALQPCWILPVGIHIEPLNRIRPTAFVSAALPVRVRHGIDVTELELTVTARLDAIAAQLVQPAERLSARLL